MNNIYQPAEAQRGNKPGGIIAGDAGAAKVSERAKNQGVLNAGFEKHFSDLLLK